VRHHAVPPFWEAYNALDVDVLKLAEKSFEILMDTTDMPLRGKQEGRFFHG
jgi:hypothetical protein